MARKRIFLGGLSHETNTFNPVQTTLADLERGMLVGPQIMALRRGTNTEIGGFVDQIEEDGSCEIVPALYAEALPGGTVTDNALETVLAGWLDLLRRQSVDGLLLALHGAMATQSQDDAEGHLLGRLRGLVGRDLPIICTLDIHATLTPEMARHADGLVIYRTYPHMDLAARGREAARIMLATLRGERRPAVAIAKRPLLIGPPHNVLPHHQPMARIMERARTMEESIPGVIAACPAQGFMQQDVPYGGVGAAVTVDRDLDMGQRLAEELAERLYASRRQYYVDLPSPAEAIALAAKSDRPPVAIADSGDNIGGGTPGDGTCLLAEILRQGVTSAFVHLVDAQAARVAARAGVGATVNVAVGGRSDPLYGPPVEIRGVVRAVTDGVYLNRAWGGYSAGVVSDMGLTARIDMGGITVVVSSERYSPNNIMHAKSVGVFPEDYGMSVCKGGLAFREAYKPPVANSYVQADTPGYSSSNLDGFRFEKLKRPIYPLDPI